MEGKEIWNSSGDPESRVYGILGPLDGPWRHKERSDPAPLVDVLGEGRLPLISIIIAVKRVPRLGVAHKGMNEVTRG